jgi:hypothetical protein
MQSIPYDPALALGDIADENILKNMETTAKAAALVDAVQDELNALILAKRSLNMTLEELTGLAVDTENIKTAVVKLDAQIAAAAESVADSVIQCQEQLVTAKKNRSLLSVKAGVESPLDYDQTDIKRLPLAVDSLKFDAQYFSNNGNAASAIGEYVKNSLDSSTSMSQPMAATALAQAVSQYQSHNVEGTLVITAGCTHKYVQLLAPLVVDPDKGIRVWNALFPDDPINSDDPESIASFAKGSNLNPNGKGFKLISGATYGSSFVGMVHILRAETTSSKQGAEAITPEIRQMIENNLAFEGLSGGIGLSPSVASHIKRMISKQRITSHCSLISMGIVPPITPSLVSVAVKEFANFDPEKMMKGIAVLENSTASELNTEASSAKEAKTAKQLMQQKTSIVETVMSGLSDIDTGQTQVLDTNTLMIAFKQFVEAATSGSDKGVGVPINYYLKTITKSEVARLWLKKYYPPGNAAGGEERTSTKT